MSTRPGISARPFAAEHGFTLLEVLMAALMLAVIVSAMATLFVHGSDASVAAQRDSQLISIADQQIETIREKVKTDGFDALAMSSAPTSGSHSAFSYSSTTYADPNDFVSPSTGCGASSLGYDIETNFDNTAEGPGSGVAAWSGCTDTGSKVAEPLEILPAGFVTWQQTNVPIGSSSDTSNTATVDTYVTDTYVGCSITVGSCPTTTGNVVSGCTWPTGATASTVCADARRVIVAVVLSDNGRYTLGQSSPVYETTVFTNPTPSNASNSSIGLTLGLQLG